MHTTFKDLHHRVDDSPAARKVDPTDWVSLGIDIPMLVANLKDSGSVSFRSGGNKLGCILYSTDVASHVYGVMRERLKPLLYPIHSEALI